MSLRKIRILKFRFHAINNLRPSLRPPPKTQRHKTDFMQLFKQYLNFNLMLLGTQIGVEALVDQARNIWAVGKWSFEEGWMREWGDLRKVSKLAGGLEGEGERRCPCDWPHKCSFLRVVHRAGCRFLFRWWVVPWYSLAAFPTLMSAGPSKRKMTRSCGRGCMVLVEYPFWVD